MTGAECQHLVQRSILTDADLERARAHTGSGETDVETALIELGILTQEQLGRALADMYQLPYAPLASAEAILADGHAMSRECCEHWHVMPLRYDPAGSILALSVANPERAEAMQRIYAFLMKPFDLAFTIASSSEIVSALQQRFGHEPKPGPAAPAAGGKQKLSIPKKPAAISRSAPSPGEQRRPAITVTPSGKPQIIAPHRGPAKQPPTASVAGTTKPADASAKELDIAHDLARPLINAMALLVGARLEGDAAHLARVRARARYCQLLASRMQSTALELTKAVLAAWVASLENRSDLLKQLMLPFDVEDVISPPERTTPDLPSDVLALVMSYEAFMEGSEATTADVNLVRRHLLVEWSNAKADHDTLEMFLQVLMDEQFLRTFDTATGSVLIVDPGAQLTAKVEQPLTRAGCRVESVSTTRLALESAREHSPDLIIADAQTAAPSILSMCRDVNTDYPDTRMIVISAPDAEVRGAEFLRAGVNDLLAAPVDLEVLYLTVEKNLAPQGEPDAIAREGVSGSLADMTFNDMIQVLSAGAKSIRISVTNNAEHGLVYMRDGDIVDCELGDLRGPDAFYALMHWQEGEFAATQCREFPDPTISVSTMSLLMEGSRQLDEEAVD